MVSFGKNRKSRPLVLAIPPSQEERHQRKLQNAYPSPPSSQRRHGGPSRKEIEFAKTMDGHPNEIKTQCVATSLPETAVKPPVETEEMRLQAIEERKARDIELQKQNKHVNLDYLLDQIMSRFPSDEFMVVSPNIFWEGGDDMVKYYEWLNDEYYDGTMPEIVRCANAFRGFPQLDDEDFNPYGAAERRAYYRSQKGREELRPYLPSIKKYASKGEYVLIEAQVNGQTASDALDAATAAKGEPEAKYEEEPASSAAAGLSPYYLKQEPLTTGVQTTFAVDDRSTRVDRSATLGRTPQGFKMSPGLFVTPNPDSHFFEDGMDPEPREMIKDEPISSTVSGYLRAFQATYEPEAAVEKGDEHTDEKVKDEVEEMSADDFLPPLATSPDRTPTKKPQKQNYTSRKRKDLYDGIWEPSSAGGVSSNSDDDEEPPIKRVKQSHSGAARR